MDCESCVVQSIAVRSWEVKIASVKVGVGEILAPRDAGCQGFGGANASIRQIGWLLWHLIGKACMIAAAINIFRSRGEQGLATVD